MMLADDEYWDSYKIMSAEVRTTRLDFSCFRAISRQKTRHAWQGAVFIPPLNTLVDEASLGEIIDRIHNSQTSAQVNVER